MYIERGAAEASAQSGLAVLESRGDRYTYVYILLQCRIEQALVSNVVKKLETASNYDPYWLVAPKRTLENKPGCSHDEPANKLKDSIIPNSTVVAKHNSAILSEEII